MRTFRFGKLVRDKIVEGIIAGGGVPKWKTLSGKAYTHELKKKISEEASEIVDASDGELLDELADIQEIIDNLLSAIGKSKKELSKAQEVKNQKRGSFKNRRYIDVVKVKDNAEVIKFYLEHPDKYPEVLD